MWKFRSMAHTCTACQAPQYHFIGTGYYFSSFRRFSAYSCTNNVWQYMLHLNIFVKTNQTSSPVTIPLKIKCRFACLGLLRDNELASQYSYVNCIKLIRHQGRGKNRRNQMNFGKRYNIQAARTAHTEIPEERWNLLWSVHLELGQPKREAVHLVKTWTKADIQHKRLCSGDRYEDSKYEAPKRQEHHHNIQLLSCLSRSQNQLMRPTRFQYKLNLWALNRIVQYKRT